MASPKKDSKGPELAKVDEKKSLESHIFRCAVDDFKSLLRRETEYRYEYECGRQLCGEPVKLWFDIHVPMKNRTSNSSKKEYIDFKGGVQRKTKLPVMLTVVPKLLNSDGTVFFVCVERCINLKNQQTLSWNDAAEIQLMQNTKTVTRDNKCLFEFHVTLMLNNQLMKLENSKKSSPHPSQAVPIAQKNRPTAESNSVKRVNGNGPIESETSSLKKIKLDSMQVKLTADLKSVLASQEQADVIFSIKDEKLKAHRIILSARSKAFAAMFAEEKKVDGAWTIVIDDVDSSVMKIALEYIYTGKVEENWKEYADKLLLAASQFELTELMEYLDLRIPELFTVENSCIYLQLSKRLHLKNMENEMTKFFLKNRDAIIKTAGFENLRETNPAVLVDWLLAKS